MVQCLVLVLVSVLRVQENLTYFSGFLSILPCFQELIHVNIAYTRVDGGSAQLFVDYANDLGSVDRSLISGTWI